MATIDKRGDKWRAQVRRKGLGSVSRSFISKKDAERWARDTEKAIEAGSFESTPKPDTASDAKQTTLAQLLERYRDTVSVKKKGKEFETYILNAFLRDHPKLAGKKLETVTSADWAGYRDTRLKDIKAASLKRQLVIFQNCYEVARKEFGFTNLTNPLADLSLDYVDQRRDRRLNDGELEAILTEAGKRKNKLIVPVIEWCIATGMRRSEVLSLTWNDVDFKNRVVTVSESKNGHSRKLPLLPKMREILEGLDPVSERVFPIADANFKSTWKRILAKAGIEGLTAHDMRHECISSLFEKDLSVPQVASISGHKSWKMLARYTHPKPADILRKLELVKA